MSLGNFYEFLSGGIPFVINNVRQFNNPKSIYNSKFICKIILSIMGYKIK